MTEDSMIEKGHNLSAQSETTVEATGGRKVLMITMDFDLGPKKTHATRLKEAYHAAVAAADKAVREILLEGSIVGLRTRMQYDYRHLEGTFVGWDIPTDGIGTDMDGEEDDLAIAIPDPMESEEG